MDAPADREHTPTFMVNQVLSVDLEGHWHTVSGPIEIATLLNANVQGVLEHDVVDGKDGRMVPYHNCDSADPVFSEQPKTFSSIDARQMIDSSGSVHNPRFRRVTAAPV